MYLPVELENWDEVVLGPFFTVSILLILAALFVNATTVKLKRSLALIGKHVSVAGVGDTNTGALPHEPVALKTLTRNCSDTLLSGVVELADKKSSI